MQAVAKGLELGLIDEPLMRLMITESTNDSKSQERPNPLAALRPLLR